MGGPVAMKNFRTEKAKGLWALKRDSVLDKRLKESLPS